MPRYASQTSRMFQSPWPDHLYRKSILKRSASYSVNGVRISDRYLLELRSVSSRPTATEVQITVAERHRRLSITLSAQIFASLVFDLSYLYAIVTDLHTRVWYLFSKPRYSALMNSHYSRSRAAQGATLFWHGNTVCNHDLTPARRFPIPTRT